MTGVAIVTPRYPPLSSGGGEKSTELLATQLQAQDRIDDVTVFAFDGGGTTERNGVTVHRLGAVSPFITELQNLSVARKLRGHLGGFDAVHAYNMELHPVVGYLSDRAGVPSVGTLNSYHFFPSSVTNTTAEGLERIYELIGLPTTGRVLRRGIKHIDVLVALSHAIGDIYRDNGFEESQIEHIPNMIDPDFEVPNGPQTDSNQLLYVGTLTENKGVRYLIEALARLPPEYSLRIVGDGDRMEELQTLATSRDVADRIEFCGWVPYEQIGQFYAEAGVFVHPGIWPEPLNRTVLEAMQAELPVVCTDIGGPPEVIPDEELICEPGDADSLAAAIRQVDDMPADTGQQNRQHVVQNHSPAAVVPQIVDLYEDLSSR